MAGMIDLALDPKMRRSGILSRCREHRALIKTGVPAGYTPEDVLSLIKTDQRLLALIRKLRQAA